MTAERVNHGSRSPRTSTQHQNRTRIRVSIVSLSIADRKGRISSSLGSGAAIPAGADLAAAIAEVAAQLGENCGSGSVSISTGGKVAC